KKLLKTELTLLHIHHGDGEKSQVKFRNEAQQTVDALALQFKLPIHAVRRAAKSALKSEADFRDYRQKQFAKERQKFAATNERVLICTAHHLDDLVETRMMRLVRGTGKHGLAGMQIYSEEFLRPLLNQPRQALLQYANENQLKWVEDPTNQSREPLRNWMR